MELKVDFKLKHIIVGFWNNSENLYVQNLLIVIVSYSMHSTWTKCKFENKSYAQANILINIKKYNNKYKFSTV